MAGDGKPVPPPTPRDTERGKLVDRVQVLRMRMERTCSPDARRSARVLLEQAEAALAAYDREGN